MKKVGIIGGMSWISTEIYYRHINNRIRSERGGLASAPMIIDSLDFAKIGRTETQEHWAVAGDILAGSAKRLEQAGADLILIAANSMHKVYDQVQDAVDVEILHIAECVGRMLARDNVKTAALVGTANVMTEAWYRQRLVKHGVTLLEAKPENVSEIDEMIYDKLMLGVPTRDAERTMKTIITRHEQSGAKAVVLGCTELSLVVDTRANVLPIYDSARIHADAAVDFMLQEG